MVFTSIQFVIFFAVFITLFFSFKKDKTRKWLLLFSSIFFYAYWNLRFVPLLISLSLFNDFIGKKLDNGQIINKKKWLFVGVLINLAVLCYFKYANFFISSFIKAFSIKVSEVHLINVVLPVGISFFIFEFISYLVDVYKGRICHTAELMDFMLFSFFFPRIASGPIIRPSDFLPQLNELKPFNKVCFINGFQIFSLGLFKKLVIADSAAKYSDVFFSSPGSFDTATAWLAIISYSIQIYADFSGYSDMAIGISKMIGFELPMNFNMPYISRSLSEFWKRWHISLSSWLRDYLYIPLGGSRCSKLRMNVNLLVTMLLGGLWHGANWTFIIWGGLHGIGLVLQKLFSEWIGKYIKRRIPFLYDILSWAVTFIFVLIAWVFFRAPNVQVAFLVLQKMFSTSWGVHWIYTPLINLIIPTVVFATTYCCLKKANGYRYLNLERSTQLFLFVFLLISIFILKADNTSPFIYFQF